MFQRWLELVHKGTLRALGLETVSDVAERLSPGLGGEALTEALTQRLIDRLLGILEQPVALVAEAQRRDRGFRRWALGQCALFARYEPLVGLPPLCGGLVERLHDDDVVTGDEAQRWRARWASWVDGLGGRGVVSVDDARVFREVFPLFDPFFLRDYDHAQEFEDLADASREALR